MRTLKFLWYSLLFLYHGTRMNMLIKQRKPVEVVQARHTLSEHYYKETKKLYP